MSDTPDRLHELGAFEPMEIRRLLPVLEANEIEFELEADHSELQRPGRTLQLYFGMYPQGSKLAVFVREHDLPKARQLLEYVFPV